MPVRLGREADRLHELQLPPGPLRRDLGPARRAGEVAHTGCVAFGMDRLAVAMFATHGAETKAWPHSVREALKL